MPRASLQAMPAEIRHQILLHLLPPIGEPWPSDEPLSYKEATRNDADVLLPPYRGPDIIQICNTRILPGLRFRSLYTVRDGRVEGTSTEASYRSTNTGVLELQIGILSTCRTYHAHAAPIFYTSYQFEFDTSVEAAPLARSAVRRFGVAFNREIMPGCQMDRAERDVMCAFVARELSLNELSLSACSLRLPHSSWLEHMKGLPVLESGLMRVCMDGHSVPYPHDRMLFEATNLPNVSGGCFRGKWAYTGRGACCALSV